MLRSWIFEWSTANYFYAKIISTDDRFASSRQSRSEMGFKMTYQKNQITTVTIEDIGNDGEGIGKVDGYTLFVKDAVIGDVVKARITRPKKNYAYARCEEILTPSTHRTNPRCTCHRQCGGCQIQALDYDTQLQFKYNKVRDCLIRLGGFSEEKADQVLEPIVGMEEPFHYRNKALFPVGTDRNGAPVTGFFAGRTHDIIPNTDCALGVAENKQILESILSYMRDEKISAYDEKTGMGLIRHVLIRKGFTSGQIMVCLIVNGTELPASHKLIDRLTQIDGMTSICLNTNTRQTNVVLGDRTSVLWGSDTIEDQIHVRRTDDFTLDETAPAVTYRISAQSFYQVNPVQTEKLYSLALEYAGLTGKETVWDLYCGIGTISLFLAAKAKKVYGVEIVPQAIEDARNNAKYNGITNSEFFVGKAEEVLPAFYNGVNLPARVSTDETPSLASAGADAEGAFSVSARADETPLLRASDEDMKHPDVIVVDPPRKGCDPVCIETMLRMQPSRIVYVSCDPATLARDLKLLTDGGYHLEKVRPVDQFAQTVHVETVCLLSKLHEAKHHVNVTVDMDEMDITSAESKAHMRKLRNMWLSIMMG